MNNSKVFSINISKTKGIPKTPIDSAKLIEGVGLENDAHAAPGEKQISLLAIESIRRQSECEKVKKSATGLKPGDFAENITTEGISLVDLKIGAKLKIGEEVIIEISKIGKDCHKYCAIYYKLGDCIMPREGIFSKVLVGGKIKVGDEINIVNGLASLPVNGLKSLIIEPGNSQTRKPINVSVLTISDTRNKSNDDSGKTIMEILSGSVIASEAKQSFSNDTFEICAYDIVKDDKQTIKDILIHYADSLVVDVILTTGGTGLSPRDVTPEATAEVIDRQVPGISEFIRIEGLQHTEKSMLSRGISGIRKNSLIINLPGSPKGARESLNTVLKILPHAISMLKGQGHGK